MKEQDVRADSVYLSLGDREEKTRNPLMATVGDCIREGHELLLGRGIRTTLEWNPGNHFKDAGIRMAKGFVWLMKNNADYVELEVYENIKILRKECLLKKYRVFLNSRSIAGFIF